MTGKVADLDQEIDGEQRYRDYGIFNYWFRMIEKHAPWVNNVYLITNGQKARLVEFGSSKTQIGHS